MSERAHRFSARRPGAATIALLGSIAVIGAVVFEAGSRAFVYGFENWRADYRSTADGYEGAAWTDDYYREFRRSGVQEWRPYVYWRRPAYAGQYINIDADGVRRSWQPPPSDGQPRVLFTGGSTIWGTGSRDDFTVPSEIARQSRSDGLAIRVINLAESGYVSSQSVAAILNAVRAGDRPAAVVIYGGAEDVFSAYQNGAAGLPQNELNRRQEFNSMQPAAFDKVWSVLTAGTSRAAALVLQRAAAGGIAPASVDTKVLARSVIDTYCANVRSIAGLGREFGFRVVAFWQPTLFTKPERTAYEQREAARSAAVGPLYELASQLIAADARCATPIHDLSGVFQSQRAPRFVDAMHPTELGNRELASASLPAVRAALAMP